jgi:rare lipoprotein A
MKYVNKFSAVVVAATLLGSCGGKVAGGSPETASLPQSGAVVPDYPVKIGEPYQVGGKTYAPEDVTNYDDVGYASFYGQELASRPTANGEVFNPQAISGAHKTLPLPSYVEVTALDTGKTILVRINDRGPFANDRVVDLSEGAARQLGIMDQGVAGVRIRRVSPAEQDRASLRSGSSAMARLDTPESLLKVLRTKLAAMPKPAGGNAMATAPLPATVRSTASNASPAPIARSRDGRFVREGSAPAPRATAVRQPAPEPAPQSTPLRQAAPVGDDRFVRESGARSPARAAVNEPAASSSSYVVQLGSFSSRTRADALARKLGAKVMPSSNGNLFRVSYGPYASEAEAQTGLAKARQRGYPQAKIFRE